MTAQKELNNRRDTSILNYNLTLAIGDLSILIVDDEPFNLLVLENLLFEFKLVKI